MAMSIRKSVASYRSFQPFGWVGLSTGTNGLGRSLAAGGKGSRTRLTVQTGGVRGGWLAMEAFSLGAPVVIGVGESGGAIPTLLLVARVK